MRTLKILMLSITTTIVACGDSGTETENEATLQIAEWSYDEGCDDIGVEEVRTLHDPLLRIANIDGFGGPGVLATTCSGDDCDSRAQANYEGIIDERVVFFDGDDEVGFTAQLVSAGVNIDGDCVGSLTTVSLSFPGTASAEMVIERTGEIERPENEDGFCTTRGVFEATKDLPCAEREVITALEF